MGRSLAKRNARAIVNKMVLAERQTLEIEKLELETQKAEIDRARAELEALKSSFDLKTEGVKGNNLEKEIVLKRLTVKNSIVLLWIALVTAIAGVVAWATAHFGWIGINTLRNLAIPAL